MAIGFEFGAKFSWTPFMFVWPKYHISASVQTSHGKETKSALGWIKTDTAATVICPRDSQFPFHFTTYTWRYPQQLVQNL
jgi:hypothetical protein